METESVGEILREARHQKKASLEDAARATKIKLEILEKLESDEFDRLAAPMYTKGFLKLYAEYLGLDSQFVVDSYLRSQGGLRRQGLQVETEKTARERKRPEVQLPIRSVVLAVAGVTVAVILGLVGRSLWTRHTQKAAHAVTPAAAPTAVAKPAMPQAGFDAYYEPKSKPAAELLEPPAAK
jgi:cytoskeletal protein RodZ